MAAAVDTVTTVIVVTTVVTTMVTTMEITMVTTPTVMAHMVMPLMLRLH